MVKIRLAARRLVQKLRRRNTSDDDNSSTNSTQTLTEPDHELHLHVLTSAQLYVLAQIIARKVAESLSERVPSL